VKFPEKGLSTMAAIWVKMKQSVLVNCYG
jgi:hypothetical protein